MFAPSREDRKPSVDMAQVVGTSDILFVCLDTLRYDVAVQEESIRRHTCAEPVWFVAEMSGAGKFYISITSCDVCGISALSV